MVYSMYLKLKNALMFGVLSAGILTAQTAFAGSYEDYFNAIAKDNDWAVSNLLNRGFDPKTPNEKGLNGLFVALNQGALKVAKILIQSKGLPIDDRNEHDETPLMIASIKGYLEAAKQLIDQGADVNKPGWTPLHYAASKGNIEMMRLLLEENAYIDAASPNGTTPLMMAAGYSRNPLACKVLLEEGADPTLINDKDLSAMDFAAQEKQKESFELIKAYAQAWRAKYQK
jgi:ankyrin repeat protein